MLEPNPMNRPSGKVCLLDPWIQKTLPFSQPDLEQTSVPLKSPETISEQSTELWNPPIQDVMADPTVQGALGKRVRSSESMTLGVQSSKRSVKAPQVDKNLERNVRGGLADRMYVQDREDDMTKRLGHASRTPRYGCIENLPPKLPGKSIPQVQITAGQIGQKMIRKRGPPRPSNEKTPNRMAEVTNFDSEHVQMKVEDHIVLLRKKDCFLNTTQIIELANKDKNERNNLLDEMKKYTIIEIRMISAIRGPWVDFRHGRNLCKHLGLEQQMQPLFDYTGESQGESAEIALAHDQDYLAARGVKREFVAVPALPTPVCIRKLDWRVNATQILRVAGRNECHMAKIRIWYKGAYDIVLYGGSKSRGTYVDFEAGINLCQEYGLVELECQIVSARMDLEVHPRNAAGQIRESMRPDSTLPQERRDSQRTASMSQSDTSDQEDDTRVDDEYPISDAASGSSTSSSETSTGRERESSVVNLGANDSPLHQQSFPKETERQSLPVKNSRYSVWDSQSEHSRLSIFKPDLKPPSRTVSPCESFTNFL